MRSYVDRVWHLRHFWMALVRNDLRHRYRRSMIGIGWSLLHPLAMTTVLCVVFAGLLHAEIRTFCPHLITGLVTWNFFTASVMQGAQCFIQGESYIRQVPAPLAIFPLRTILGAGFHFLLGLLVAVGVTAVLHGLPNPAAVLLIVPALPLLFVVGWALAVCFGVCNVLFQDTQHLSEVGLQILFYLTPILYKADMLRERNLGWLVDSNPLGACIEMIRQPLLEGHAPPALTIAVATGFALFMLGLAASLLARFERRIIFYL